MRYLSELLSEKLQSNGSLTAVTAGRSNESWASVPGRSSYARQFFQSFTVA